MKIKRALIPLAITVLLSLAAAPALAANSINQGTAPAYTNTGSTNVTASVDTTYTVTIPDNNVLKFEKLTPASPEADRTKTFEVSAAGVMLEPDKQLKVTVSGKDHAFQMSNAALSSVKLPYTITPLGAATALSPGDPIAVFQNNEAKSVSSKLVVNAPTMGAGNYFDTLTFTCTVEGGTP